MISAHEKWKKAQVTGNLMDQKQNIENQGLVANRGLPTAKWSKTGAGLKTRGSPEAGSPNEGCKGWQIDGLLDSGQQVSFVGIGKLGIYFRDHMRLEFVVPR